MKKMSILIICFLVLILTACGNNTLSESVDPSHASETTTAAAKEKQEATTPEQTQLSNDFTKQEISDLNAFLNRNNDRIPCMFLICSYEKPEEIDFNMVFYNGTSSDGVPGPDETVSEEEKEIVAKAIGKEDMLEHGLPIQKRPRKKLEALIKKYTGLSEDAVSEISMDFPYVKEFDAYYSFYGDSEPFSPKVSKAIWLDEGHMQAQIEWEDSQRSMQGTAVMQKTADGWCFVSNQIKP